MKTVYIHIPFCKSICSYCDFPKVYDNIFNKLEYIKCLKKEIKKNYKNDIIKSIYIGGGTPSSLNYEELNELLLLTNMFKKSDDLEFTIECNIESITKEKLMLLKKFGVNRLSIGIESFQNKIIKYLNRNHTKKEAINKIKLVKKYFKNINIDLMYAIPIQKLSDLKKDLKTFIKLDLPHISYYSLIIEPHTKLFNDNIDYIDEDIDYKMYKIINRYLKKYNHYEISNYSKKGFESIHNLNYWNNGEYYGFGMGASGYINGVRYNNTKSIISYLKGKTKIEENVLTNKQIMEEEMFLGLRKKEGVNILKFKEKYNKNIDEVFDIQDLLNDKLMIRNNYIYINPKYIYTSNDIMVRFIGD